MSVKTQRKIKAESDSYKIRTPKKVRSSASKNTSKSNGKYPLAAYEHLHIGVVQSSPDGKYIDVNEEFCRIVGYSKKELLQLGVRDCTHEDDYALDINLHEQLVTGKIPFYGLEKRYVRKDGQLIWVELTRSLVRAENGKPLGTIGTVIDISDYKHVERVLRESAENLRLATEAARVFKWELDFQKQLYTFADNFVQVLGFSAGLLPQNSVETVWRLSPAEDVQAISAAIDKAIKSHRDINSLQYRVIDPESGQTVWLEVNAKVVYDHQGNAQRMFGVAQNITESRRAQEEIRILSKLPSENPNPVMRLTPDGKVLYANNPGQDLLEIWKQQINQPIPNELKKHVAETFASGLKKEIEIPQNEKTFSFTLAPIREAGYVNLYGKDITERKQAEQALRESEERYRGLFDLVPIAVYTCDANGLIKEYNQRAAELWGREPKINDPQEKYCGAFKLYYPDGRFMPHERTPMSRVLAGETLDRSDTEILIERPDGSRRNVIAHPLPLRNERGLILEAINCLYDITEHKQVEEALRESEERFKAILRQATAGIVRKDAEGRFIFVNEAFCKMLGYTEADLLGKTVWEFMHQDDIVENKRSFDRLMKQGVPFKLERRFLRRDGSIIWVDASVSPLMDAEGRPQSAVAVEVDITGRKQAEESLRQLNLQLESRVQKRTATIQAINQSLREEIAERKRIEEALRVSEALARASEEKLRTLFDLLPVGISFLDPEGRITQMNSALPNIVRLSKEQSFNQEYKSRKYIRADGTLMPPAELVGMRALAEAKTIYNVETGILLENDEVVWTSVSAAPVNVAEVGVVVVTVDITEKKRAEQALQESHGRLRILSQRLVEVQEEERRALARELHDRVGQTLAALNINLIIINNQLAPELVQQIGARLNDSMKLVGETIALVRDVMTDLRPAVLDDYGLEAALESHLGQYTSRYNTIKATFEKPGRPIPRLGPSVEMTLLRIAQEALMNIAKHAHAEHVTLSLRQEEESVCLTIQDDGIGIGSWQDAIRPGSHGLTIMRERAEAFGGNLSVSSVPGRGTIVEAILPFKNDHQAQSQEEQHL